MVKTIDKLECNLINVRKIDLTLDFMTFGDGNY